MTETATIIPEELLTAERDAQADVPEPTDGEAAPPQPKAFEITDAKHCSWVLERRAEIEGEIEKVRAVAQAHRDKADQYEEAATRSLMWRARWWDGALENFARREYEGSREAQQDKGRTIKLPAGNLSLRKQQPEWDYDDEALVAWIQKHAPEECLLRVVTQANKAELKKQAVLDGPLVTLADNLTGEARVVAGVTVTQRSDPAFALKLVKKGGE